MWVMTIRKGDARHKPAFRLAGLVFWIGICCLVAWTGTLVSPGMAPSDWYDALSSGMISLAKGFSAIFPAGLDKNSFS